MHTAVLGLILAGAVADPGQAPDSGMATALSVEAAGECPHREAVLAALRPVVGKDAIRSAHGTPRVSDLGDRFEVTAAGQTGQYVDVARDCVERARVAAVFIALALNPPVFQSNIVPPARETDAEVRALPPPEPPADGSPERWARLAVGARADGASPGNGFLADVAFGAEVRGALGRRSWGLAAGAGVLAPTTRTFGSVPVRQQRFPFSLAVTARRRVSDSVEVGADLGVSLVLLTLRGDKLETAAPATRLDTGARFACAIRFPNLTGWMVPFAEVHAEFFPRPYVLDVDPLGDIGKTNRLWLGMAAGVSFGSP